MMITYKIIYEINNIKNFEYITAESKKHAKSIFLAKYENAKILEIITVNYFYD